MLSRFPLQGRIDLAAIRVSAHIGVPDEERALPQTLEIDLSLVPTRELRSIDDDLAKTINYYEVWLEVRSLAAERPRKLIETLAEEIADQVLAKFDISQIEVTVRKFILPDTGAVSVSLFRTAGNS